MSHRRASKECRRNGGNIFSRETKPSPRSPFDQRHHLITCIPERAFIWNRALIPLVCSEWIQRGTRKFCGGTQKDETDVNDEESSRKPAALDCCWDRTTTDEFKQPRFPFLF